LGDYAAARDYDVQALAIRRAIGDRPSEATTLINLGQVSLQIGDLDRAAGYIEEALPLAHTIGDRRSEGLALNTLGSIWLARASYAQALQHLEQAQQIFQAIGDRRLRANCLVSLGLAWRDLGNDERALAMFEQALAVQREIGDESLAAYGYLNLAYARRLSDPATALTEFEQALMLARRTGNSDAEAFALSYRAALYEAHGRWHEAAADYQAALPMLEELQATAAAIECSAGLGRAALAAGDLAAARGYAARCMAHLAAEGSDGMEFPILVYLTCYDILRTTDETAEAQRLLAAAHELLMTRAAQIDVPQLRAGLLELVAAHRRVITEYAALQP
ncbi:MAG TPA: tetratricopeptide repeat protein, partial [Roseiflexaceae bacterium]|nr:tetratricopeptide repeat protein [Roseiflexaceae bacterium]